jgi:outer membrane receptor for Fe3+-dicitrate
MTNILKAIYNISKLDSFSIVQQYKNSIRIQQAGDSLEYFIKDAFCNSLKENNLKTKEDLYSKYFSYLGNANNPPDIIIKGAGVD